MTVRAYVPSDSGDISPMTLSEANMNLSEDTVRFFLEAYTSNTFCSLMPIETLKCSSFPSSSLMRKVTQSCSMLLIERFLSLRFSLRGRRGEG
jgi:hypothetical protein